MSNLEYLADRLKKILVTYENSKKEKEFIFIKITNPALYKLIIKS